MTERVINLEKKLVKTDKILRKARQTRAIVIKSLQSIDNKYDFSASSWLRGNFLGNFIRGSKIDKMNKNIDRVQKSMLKLEADLMVYDIDNDTNLAGFLRLPSKMSESGKVTNKFTDIGLRTSMRFRQFDVVVSLRNLETIIKRLEEIRHELKNDLKGSMGYLE